MRGARFDRCPHQRMSAYLLALLKIPGLDITPLIAEFL